MRRRRWLPLLPVPFAWALSTSLLVPVLPRLARELDAGPVGASLLLTALSLPAGLLLPVAGWLSDRLGRRPVLAAGLVVYGLGGLVAGLAASAGGGLVALVAARALQGVGAAATYTVALSAAADLAGEAGRLRAVGALEAANSAGKLAAPLLGAATATLAWYAPFFVYPAVAWPTAGLVWAAVPETVARPDPPRAYGRALARAWRVHGRALAAAGAAGFVALASWFGLLVVYADALERAGPRGELLRGALVSLPVALLALGAALGGRWGERWAPARLAAWGLAVAALAAAAAAVGWPVRGLGPAGGGALAMAVLGCGLGAALAGLDAQVTAAAPGPERGLVTTLWGAVRALGGAAGPPALAAAAALGPAAAWGAAAAGLGLAALALRAAGRAEGSRPVRGRPEAG